MSSDRVIVFGPTGGVGSHTALAAHENGATVYLAMRDPSKVIEGLSVESEKAGRYERVQADLIQPQSVESAVKKTGAKRAFLYLMHASTDHMKATIQALKSGGVESVVFLSSYGIRSDIHQVKPDEIISYLHAQVEINLEQTFGAEHFVAVRPAWFASNSYRYKGDFLRGGPVRVCIPDAEFDFITAVDIGNVCGSLLASGQQLSPNYLNLCGPKLIPQGDAIKMIVDATGKDLSIKSIPTDEAIKMYVDEFKLPEPIAKYLVGIMEKAKNDGQLFSEGYEDAAANVQKYGGKKPTSFADWVEQNKKAFVA